MKRLYTEPKIETVLLRPQDCLLASPEECELLYSDLLAEMEEYLEHGMEYPR